MNSTFEQAKVLYNLNRYDEALTLLHKANADEPRNIEVYVLTAWIYYATNRSEIGLKVAGQALAVNPENVRVLTVHGACATSLRKSKTAKDSLLAALRLDPENSFAYFHFALYWAKDRSYNEALEYLEVAISLEPENSHYLSVKSQLQTLLGKNHEAKESALHALNLNADAAEGHVQLGKILRGEGNLRESVQSLKEAVRNDPANERMRQELFESLRCRFIPYRWIHTFDFWLSQFPYWKRALFWTSPLSLGTIGILAACLLYMNESFLISRWVAWFIVAYIGLFIARFCLKHLAFLFLDGLIAFDASLSFMLPRHQRIASKIAIILLVVGMISLAVGSLFHSTDLQAVGVSCLATCFIVAYLYSLAQRLHILF